jgi:hypothetical protein
MANISVELRVDFGFFDKITPEFIGAAYASAAYKQIDMIYGQKAQTIKDNSSILGNKITVDGFLAQALLLGKESYDLKAALTSSDRTKQSSKSGKYLAVPITKNKVVTMTEKSDGWKHPGFSSEYFEKLNEFINNLSLFQAFRMK